MVDVDKWLADAANLTKREVTPIDSDKVMQQIGFISSPASSSLALARLDARLMMLCAAVAAIVALAGLDSIASKALEQPVTTWIAAPPAASPFGLLVGE
ncbi:CnrY/NccY family anti-sigma factor [Comamonas thiooxydans]|uniref:CnrY/NccY family anti-sigma factor n=1 Tax=Comamonas TaxID=283 RepID=UPI00035F900B|nr:MULTISPECIES: CnrY/NccY family anti-sigma factor [Comamonas]BDR09403.1 CnrY/NccY family anti-sigma factor [Comamonas thiooxydans]